MAVKKGTHQTEERSKGLVGYKNGRPVGSSKDRSVGDYEATKGRSGKTLNLTKKQLGASGSKAAATRKIAISRTAYDSKTKKVLGPMGKPITGRVDLGGGNIAVYRNGVRVRASSKPSGGGPTRPTGPTGPKIDKPTYSPPVRLGKPGEYQAGKGQYARVDPGKLTPRQIASARRGEAADKRVGGNGTSRSGQSASTIRAVGKAMSISNGKPTYRPPRISANMTKAANPNGPKTDVAKMLLPIHSIVADAVKKEYDKYVKFQNTQQAKRDKMGIPRENPLRKGK